MGKILFWAIVIIGVMLAARVLTHAQARRRDPRAAPPPAPAASQPSGEAMVRCAHCGIHLPRSEALLRDGKTWCSEDHARLNQP